MKQNQATTIYINAYDGANNFAKAFTVSVTDINEAPTDIGLTSNTITENASPSTVIGTLSSVDSDTSDTASFTLATSGNTDDDDNGSFTINGTSLIINTSPDYETKASYNIYINVNDGANNYAKAFTVSVTNVNEAPIDLSFKTPDVKRRILSCWWWWWCVVEVTLVLVAVLVVSELIKLVHNLEEDVLLKHQWLLQQELIL